MRGFRHRANVEDVTALIDQRVVRLGAEMVDLDRAGGRVLAEAVVATVDVPHFARSAMDGYAVQGEETFGSESYTPARFEVIGSSRPGEPFLGFVQGGQAVSITTGAPLPAGADAVVRVESTRLVADAIEVHEPTPPGRNVGQVGEDLCQGAEVLAVGRRLRAQDLGLLSALGRKTVAVVRPPRVTIVVTGQELLPAGSPPAGWRIPDMNSPMLADLIRRDGGTSRVVGPLRDDPAVLREAIAGAASDSDVVLVSGGSSTGPEDHAPSLLAELGELAIHGIALRPASPAGVGFIALVPVLLLPGNPVSCLCAYDFFAGRAIRIGGGRRREWPYRPVALPLAAKLVSALGRTDYARVHIRADLVEPISVSGASILSGTSRADGFVIVPREREGYPAGSTVTVWQYE
jgi:molybdopterin molybdotransferase